MEIDSVSMRVNECIIAKIQSNVENVFQNKLHSRKLETGSSIFPFISKNLKKLGTTVTLYSLMNTCTKNVPETVSHF